MSSSTCLTVCGLYLNLKCVFSNRMDVNEFRVRGKEMVDYICNYMDTLESRRVTPSVEPGYLREVLPAEAPQDPEDWDAIMADVETKIMPGVS